VGVRVDDAGRDEEPSAHRVVAAERILPISTIVPSLTATSADSERSRNRSTTMPS